MNIDMNRIETKQLVLESTGVVITTRLDKQLLARVLRAQALRAKTDTSIISVDLSKLEAIIAKIKLINTIHKLTK